MALISVVTAKGGQGKSVWACALAGHLEAELLDLDPQQGDAYAWAQAASHPARCVWEHGEALVETLQAAAEGKAWHVADILPHEGETMRAAVALSKAILVPVMIGAQDARGWGRMSSLIQEARKVNRALKVGVVANGVRLATDMAKNFMPLFDQIHSPKNGIWFLGSVGLRTAISEAYARGEKISAIPGAAGQEIRAVIDSFDKNILKLKHKNSEK
jgi:cellulose biosynthesis protein BcsQ